jgi:hypothetical protein
MRRRAFPCGLAVAVACATLAAPAGSAATRPLTIKRSARILPFTIAARVSGRLASHADGVKVELRGDRWPFKSFKTVASATTHGGGHYSFRVKQPVATRYRVRLATQPAVQSRIVTVYRELAGRIARCNYCGKNAAPGRPGRHTLRITYVVRSARGTHYRPSWQYFYFGLRRSDRAPRTLRLVKRLRLHRVRPHHYRLTVRHRFRVTRSSYRFLTDACERDHFSRDGLGLPGRHHCGDRRVRARAKYLG